MINHFIPSIKTQSRSRDTHKISRHPNQSFLPRHLQNGRPKSTASRRSGQWTAREVPLLKREVVTLRGMVKSGDVDMNFGLNILSPRRLLPLLVSACLAAGATAPGRAAAATVNPHAVLVDSFAGWGTSLCWWAHVVGGYSNREEFAQLRP